MASILASGFKEEYDGGLSYKFCFKKIKTRWDNELEQKYF